MFNLKKLLLAFMLLLSFNSFAVVDTCSSNPLYLGCISGVYVKTKIIFDFCRRQALGDSNHLNKCQKQRNYQEQQGRISCSRNAGCELPPEPIIPKPGPIIPPNGLWNDQELEIDITESEI